VNDDEQAIRKLVEAWLGASKAEDIATVLGLMSDDVVFMVPGREPFGKEAFADSSKNMKDVQIEGTSEIVELRVLGDWAWMRNRLRMRITPPGGETMVRSGYTLTILRKNLDGTWVIARDANMLTPETKQQ
jgi:uncharacterized protein (TIGR02246 family)